MGVPRLKAIYVLNLWLILGDMKLMFKNTIFVFQISITLLGRGVSFVSFFVRRITPL